YLRGVHLEATQAGDLHIISTDGTRMFVGVLPGAAKDASTFSRLTIPAEVLKGAPKTGSVVLAPNGGRWQLGATLFDPCEGAFPDWRRVVPPQTEQVAGRNFDYDLLADAQTALRLWCGQSKANVARYDYEFASVVVGEDPTAFSIVMPLRNDKLNWALPFKPGAAR
ncbi:hypothetical protein, partial [Glaesserella parasuis]|uniref:hypothetical protein n=1 Tax=Glaesserella parasuis TaxID=738 RepID=UPI003F315290